MNKKRTSDAILSNLPGVFQQQFRDELPGSSPHSSIFTDRED